MKKNEYYNPYSITQRGSQLQVVLQHLFVKGSISQVEAEAVYKIRRLASRIFELKQDGWRIKRELKQDLAGQRYARYSLDKPYRKDKLFQY